MAEVKDKLVFIVTHAGEDVERATFPFLMANAALSMDTEAVRAYVEGGGDANVRNKDGWAPLHTISISLHLQLLTNLKPKE